MQDTATFSKWRWVLLPITIIALMVFRPIPTAEAHPLGNFSTNRYSRLEFEGNQLTVIYALDMAEIPTFQLWPEIDTDGDDQVSPTEQEAYQKLLLSNILENLQLSANGRSLLLDPKTAELSVVPGQGDLPTLRFDASFTAVLPAAQTWQVAYLDANYAERLGWREIVIQPSEGITLTAADTLTTDVSQALNAYPDDLLQAPLDISSVTFTAEPTGLAAVSSSQSSFQSASQPAQDSTAAASTQLGTDRFVTLITIPELTPTILLIALLTAFGLGAAHALTPGHGKTIVGAYLVGSRGTAKHALFLGLTTTITHTAGVFIFGLLVLFASQFIVPEQLYPWLGVLSGLLVVLIGGSMLWQRLHGRQPAAQETDPGYHTHFGVGHTHLPSQTHGHVSWRSLLALGVSGGLLPCPSALVVLLSAIALQRVALGLVLIIAFSIGLAGVLTAIGLTLVYAGRFFERLPFSTGRMAQLLPAVSALFITIAGIGITIQAFLQTGLL